MPPSWTEVTIDVSRAHADAVANFLMDCGAPGLQWTDEGETAQLTAYFANDPPLDALRQYCSDLGGSAGDAASARITARLVADEDWAQNWKLHSQPQLIGERFYVCPSWAAAAPEGRIAVIIDPGMAFGTGQHASTRGCLEGLDRAAARHLPSRALDVGTGSGVLAIALAKLGVSDIWAVDNDPTACTVATANAAVNNVADQVHVVSDLGGVSGRFDLVVANLYADLLEDLAQHLTALLTSDGVLIVSGFLEADEHRVRGAYVARGLGVACRHAEAPWVTLRFRAGTQP